MSHDSSVFFGEQVLKLLDRLFIFCIGRIFHLKNRLILNNRELQTSHGQPFLSKELRNDLWSNAWAPRQETLVHRGRDVAHLPMHVSSLWAHNRVGIWINEVVDLLSELASRRAASLGVKKVGKGKLAISSCIKYFVCSSHHLGLIKFLKWKFRERLTQKGRSSSTKSTSRMRTQSYPFEKR